MFAAQAMRTLLKKDVADMFFVYLILSAAIGTVSGILYNKLLANKFSGGGRTAFCALTLIIFIFSAVSAWTVIGVRSYVNSQILAYSVKTEQYVYDSYSDNDFIKRGINVNLINDGVLQVNDIISNLKTVIPSAQDLNVDKKAYDLLTGYLTKELQDRFNAVGNTVGARVAKGAAFADENGIITVSSIISFLTTMVVKQVNIVSLEIIAVLMLPLIIYIVVTVIIAIAKAVSDKRKREAIAK